MRNCVVCLVDSLRFDAIEDMEREGYLRREGLNSQLDTPTMNELLAQGTELPNLHAPFTFTPPSVGTILTGLYPREHKIYGFNRPMHPDVGTLPDFMSDAGYHTLYMNGMHMLKYNGIEGRFDEVTKGPLTTLCDRIQELNGEGIPVFAYYHTFDVHHPYMISKTPPNPDHHDLAIDEAHSLAKVFGDNLQLTRADAMKATGNVSRPWKCSGDLPIWEYLKIVHEVYAKREHRMDNPAKFLARYYVKGVNHFDRKHLSIMKDFLDNTSEGRRTVFLLTADHGDAPRQIIDSEGNELISFEHNRNPDQDLVKVPGILYNAAKEGTENIERRTLTSLADITPTLLHEMEVPAGVNFSGENLFEPPPESRTVFTEWSDTVKEEGKVFPLEAFLKWQCAVRSDGYKYWKRGTGFNHRDYSQPLAEFFRRAYIKLKDVYPTAEDVEEFVEHFEDGLENRKQKVREILQTAEGPFQKLSRWDEDHFEENDLLENPGPDEESVVRELESLLSRFPDPFDIEIPCDRTVYEGEKEEETNDENEREELKQELEDLGYL